MEAPEHPTSRATRLKKNKGLILVLSILGSVVLFLAVSATLLLGRSTRFMGASLEKLEARGESLDLHGCLKEVMEWRDSCEAMASLCDNYLGKAMMSCLSAQSNRPECSSLLENRVDTSAKQAHCSALGYDRRGRTQWKRCGISYEAAVFYCEREESGDETGR